ncbi:hypothetical protein GGX14DRAFT_410606 [Mycena pura]|uniref:J domain-containing protein n=1 Tax=Mycena pura TaxID=153505 RepID=A0AAD7E5V0_9AGAR|nr:hypothetical protein GGX14DRAFT_410606 [Mycena pura]
MNSRYIAAHIARLSHLPHHLQYLIHARLAYSTASHAQYPFPAKHHPTPQEIFHLSRGTSQEDIKRRYIELVRQHHPDSPSCRDLSPAERHRRFQMVSAAYDALRVKPRGVLERDRSTWEEIDRRKRAQQRYRHSRRAEYAYAPWNNQPADDRWTDRVILTFGFVSLIAGVIPMFLYPRQGVQRLPGSAYHLEEARREARLTYEDRIDRMK